MLSNDLFIKISLLFVSVLSFSNLVLAQDRFVSERQVLKILDNDDLPFDPDIGRTKTVVVVKNVSQQNAPAFRLGVVINSYSSKQDLRELPKKLYYAASLCRNDEGLRPEQTFECQFDLTKLYSEMPVGAYRVLLTVSADVTAPTVPIGYIKYAGYLVKRKDLYASIGKGGGDGSQDDPYQIDLDDPEAFDNFLYRSGLIGDFTHVHLPELPQGKIFLTRGTDNFWQLGTQRLLHHGQKISGAGIDKTIIKLLPFKPHPDGTPMAGAVIGEGLWYARNHHVEVSDLTLDANFQEVPLDFPHSSAGLVLRGSDQAVRRVRVINYGTNAERHECFALSVIGSGPQFGDYDGAIVEYSIVEQPALLEGEIPSPSSLSHISAGGAPAYRIGGVSDAVIPGNKGLGFYHNVRIRYNQILGTERKRTLQGITMGGCIDCVAEYNYLSQMSGLGYMDTFSTRNEIWRGNVCQDCYRGIVYNFAAGRPETNDLRQADQITAVDNVILLSAVDFPAGRQSSFEGPNLPWQNAFVFNCTIYGAPYCYKKIKLSGNIVQYLDDQPPRRPMTYVTTTVGARAVEMVDNYLGRGIGVITGAAGGEQNPNSGNILRILTSNFSPQTNITFGNNLYFAARPINAENQPGQGPIWDANMREFYGWNIDDNPRMTPMTYQSSEEVQVVGVNLQ